MRQLHGLLIVINEANLIDFYNQTLSYASTQGAKLPSLQEFLSASLNKNDDAVFSVDEKAEKHFEEIVKKRLNEMKAANNG